MMFAFRFAPEESFSNDRVEVVIRKFGLRPELVSDMCQRPAPPARPVSQRIIKIPEDEFIMRHLRNIRIQVRFSEAIHIL